MKGVVFTPAQEVYIKDFEKPLHESLGKEVDGWIEIVHPKGLSRPLCFVCNEEGLLHDLPMNAFGSILYGTHIHGHPIVGNIVVMREGMTEDGPDLIGLTDADIARIKKLANDISAGLIREVEAR